MLAPFPQLYAFDVNILETMLVFYKKSNFEFIDGKKSRARLSVEWWEEYRRDSNKRDKIIG